MELDGMGARVVETEWDDEWVPCTGGGVILALYLTA